MEAVRGWLVEAVVYCSSWRSCSEYVNSSPLCVVYCEEVCSTVYNVCLRMCVLIVYCEEVCYTVCICMYVCMCVCTVCVLG